MLELKEISKVFNTDLLKKSFTALDNLSFHVAEGTLVGYLGANGAGKTTSIKIIMDFIRASSGEVQFSHTLGTNKREVFSNIGYLPERPFFYPHLTGRDFCYYMGQLSEVKHQRINEQITYWAPRFKIDFALDREIKTYSKGMLQRIGFLVTLLHDPKLIILDEPLSGLDPIGRKELKDVMVEINKLGTTIFFSSHIVSDVEEVCDQVIFIKDGKQVFNGSVDEIINQNIQPQSDIIFLDGQELQTIKIENKDKSEWIKENCEKFDIISIKPNRPSLEEIFYNVRS